MASFVGAPKRRLRPQEVLIRNEDEAKGKRSLWVPLILAATASSFGALAIVQFVKDPAQICGGSHLSGSLSSPESFGRASKVALPL